MVSIMLLTTEEVLQRNKFWYGLDTVWFTEDMEPFEEIKQEHLFTKPLSRDFYYAKHPDIPRSESEEENSLSLNGFQCKHREWKSKIRVRRLDASRRSSSHSYLSARLRRSGSQNNVTKRITSLVENCSTESSVRKDKLHNNKYINDDERVVNFLTRLHQNIPPPPIEDLTRSSVTNASSIDFPKQSTDFSDVEVPAYDDFEKEKIQQLQGDSNMFPVTSTLKNDKRKVSFNLRNLEFESDESWNDSIYATDLIFPNTYDNPVHESGSDNSNKDSNGMDHSPPSWSEIITECDFGDYSLLQSTESIFESEKLISKSHADIKIADFENYETDDEETGYARFAIYKIYQTSKIQSSIMLDSSSMNDLSYENVTNQSKTDSLFFRTIYRLAPNSIDS